MIIAVPKETAPGEQRVALDPTSVRKLATPPVEVQVESGAGSAAGFSDEAYEAAGARIERSAQDLLEGADVVAKVRCPSDAEIAQLKEGSALLGLLQPYVETATVQKLAQRKIDAFALELMPRITRAQSMDVLSSMSSVTGYKAVLIAANGLQRFMPMLMTAAGTIKPARVIVIGAGVAGLQAIATARRLGAVVEAFDVRLAAKEQVESLGARFIAQPGAGDAEDAGGYAREQTAEELAAQRELLAERIADADALVCTALVPGRRAPMIVGSEQVKRMRAGAVVVDLAAEQGGNCELTQAGEVVQTGGITIHGPLNLASSMPTDASAMFSRNVLNYLNHLISEGALQLNLEDELTRGPLVTHGGEIVHERVREAVEGGA